MQGEQRLSLSDRDSQKGLSRRMHARSLREVLQGRAAFGGKYCTY